MTWPDTLDAAPPDPQLPLRRMPTIKFRHLIRFEPEVVKNWLREHNG